MGNSPFTFDDLTTAEGRAVIRQRLADHLAADGQPIASYTPSSGGGVESLRIDMLAGGLADLVATRIANMVRGRVLPLATDDPETGYFLSYLGLKFYKLTKRPATYTIQNMRFTAAANAAANIFRNGDLVVKSRATGNVYRLTLPEDALLELTPGASVDGPCIAERPGSTYLDAQGTIDFMVTAKAGVTCSNVKPFAYAPTRSTGGSSGTIVGFSTAAPLYSVIRFRIDTSGQKGGGSFSWSIDGGLTWIVGGPIPVTFFPPGAAGKFVFHNGGATPSFVAGSIFTLRVADAILQRGADQQSDDDFRQMCSNRHPAISLNECKAHIELWARRASDEVARVASRADPNRSGGMLVTIASQGGPASTSAQERVEDYILARLTGFKGVPAPTSPAVAGAGSPEETALVSSAQRFEVQAAATVYMPAGLIAAAQARVDLDWNAYLGGLPLGGQPNAVIEMQRFYTILGDLGADDVQGLTLNGVAADLTVPVGQVGVPASGWTLAAQLSWVAV